MSAPYIYAAYGWGAGCSEYCRVEHRGDGHFFCCADYSITLYNDDAGMVRTVIADHHEQMQWMSARLSTADYYWWSTMRIQRVDNPIALQHTRIWYDFGGYNLYVGAVMDIYANDGVTNLTGWRGHNYDGGNSTPTVLVPAFGNGAVNTTESMPGNVRYNISAEPTDAMYRRSSETVCTSTLNEQ